MNNIPLPPIPFHLFFHLSDNESLADTTDAVLAKLDVEKEEWKEIKKEWLQTLSANRDDIQEAVGKINANKALLRQLLSRQHYILTWYKVTDSEINFRRFFTVNQLICLRMEDEFVFTNYHQFIYNLYKKGLIQGLRIDHIDGLYNPQQYIDRLRNLFGKDCYIIAEKILEYNEDIAHDWDLQGTSGYEFLSYTNQLLTDKKGAQKLLDFYKELVPQTPAYFDMVFEKKHAFLHSQMGGELENLMHIAEELAVFGEEPYSRDKTERSIGSIYGFFPRVPHLSNPISNSFRSTTRS